MRSYAACALALGLAIGCGRPHYDLTRATPTPHPELGPWSTCTTTVDVAQENLAAERALAERRRLGWNYLYDLIIVPGFTPLDAATPSPVIHPTAAARLDQAVQRLHGSSAPFILVSGANVHPEGTPYIEAMLMKRYLLDRGVTEDAIFVEPCARHSHTNIRNAARFMLHQGFTRALVVTSLDQSMYFANPKFSSFEARCIADLGYRVGDFQTLPEHLVEFRPSRDVFRVGADPLDP